MVVLPVPLTPTRSTTAGRARTSILRRSGSVSSIVAIDVAQGLTERLRALQAAGGGLGLEPLDDHDGRGHTDVGQQQRLLEALPDARVLRVERDLGEPLRRAHGSSGGGSLADARTTPAPLSAAALSPAAPAPPTPRNASSQPSVTRRATRRRWGRGATARARCRRPPSRRRTARRRRPSSASGA